MKAWRWTVPMPPIPIMPRCTRSLAPTTRAAERAETPGRIVFSPFASAVVAAPSAAAAAEARFRKTRLEGDGFCVIGQTLSNSEGDSCAELDGARAVARSCDPAEVGAAL